MAFSISTSDWSLYRKGHRDMQRHKEKVLEALRANLSELVSEEGIILSDGEQLVKLPIRTLEQFRFRFDSGEVMHSGQGDGDTQVGEAVAGETSGENASSDAGPGNRPGVDYYEAEVTIDQIAELLLEELQLPNLAPRKNPALKTLGDRWTDVRRTGAWVNLDRKRTLLQAFKRNALLGRPGFQNVDREDLRFRTWETAWTEQANAVVIAMMDTSGSMGSFQKHIVRTFFFWTVRFLRQKYDQVEVVFLAHHTEAKEVPEEDFFRRGESGGTKCSSVYQLALEVIERHYPPADYNIYAIHFTDGENLQDDNPPAVELIRELTRRCRLVGYGEIRSGFTLYPTLKIALGEVKEPNFASVSITDQSGVLDALKTFFRPQFSEGEPGGTASE